MKKNKKIRELNKQDIEKSFFIHGNGYFVDILKNETLYNKKKKCLRIVYQSDTPTKKDVNFFIKKCYPKLSEKRPIMYYFDEGWHFTSSGVAYGLILVFY